MSTFLHGCKFCHVFPLYIASYNGKIYYVVHKFQSLSRTMIHLGVHNRLIVDGKCRESLEETRRLIIEEVICTLNAKMFVFPWVLARPSWLGIYLMIVVMVKWSFSKVNNWSKSRTKFYKLNSPNICSLVASFKHRPNGGYIDSILELKSKSWYDYIQKYSFLRQVLGQKVFIFKMSINVVGSGTSLVTWMQLAGDLQNAWIIFDHVKHVTSWIAMVCHVYNRPIAKWWPLRFVTCSLRTWRLNK
jgi:hypothetical protein